MSRSVVVVGGTSGIGLAVARRLAARGDRLTLVARSAERLEQVADTLPAGTRWAVADVVDADAVEAAVATAEEAHGRVDAVVTTAQALAYGTVEQVPTDVLTHVVAVAVGGTANLARAVLPRFRTAGGGHLVVVSSLLAEIAVPSMGSYCAAKWGQLGLVRTLQAEVRREAGVHVTLVLPGAVDTPIYEQAGSYAGQDGAAPPPVIGPDRVAETCVRCLERPRRIVHVGPVNWPTVVGFRAAPAVYDRIVGPMVDRVVLRGPRVAAHPGNVFEPHPDQEGPRGGWSLLGRRRRR